MLAINAIKLATRVPIMPDVLAYDVNARVKKNVTDPDYNTEKYKRLVSIAPCDFHCADLIFGGGDVQQPGPSWSGWCGILRKDCTINGI